MCYICVIYLSYMCYICVIYASHRIQGVPQLLVRMRLRSIKGGGGCGEGGAVREKVLVVTKMQTAVGGDCWDSDGGW